MPLSSFAFKRIGERFESSSTIAFAKVNVRTTFRPNDRDNRKKGSNKIEESLMYTTEKKTTHVLSSPNQCNGHGVLCTGVRGDPECQPQCRNRQHKLIQQRLMLSFDYRTHAVKTAKRKL